MKIPNPRTFFATPAIIGSTAFWASSAILSSLFDKSAKGIDFCSVTWAKQVALAAGMKVEAFGTEHVDTNQSYMVISNHQSHMDTIVLFLTCPVHVRMLAKESLSKIPIFGPAMDRAGHIWISRDKNKKTDFSKLIDQVDRLRKGGRSVVVFAEGTRSIDGKLQSFKTGGFRIAQHFGLPIMPVAIKGTHDILPSKQLDFHPGQASATYHEAIDSQKYSVEELVERTRGIIAGTLGQS